MKHLIISMAFTVLSSASQAQDIPSIIGSGISRVIRAIDLAIQRAQTKTIILQEAQKTLENTMSFTFLDDIRDWVQRQRDLYGEYFQELQQVKSVISNYHRVKEAIQRQEAIVSIYRQDLRQFRQDPHLNSAELSHIEAMYTGILTSSAANLEQLLNATVPGMFEMSHQQRLATIDTASDSIDRNYQDLLSFTRQNQLLSLQRAKDQSDYLTLLKLYGL